MKIRHIINIDILRKQPRCPDAATRAVGPWMTPGEGRAHPGTVYSALLAGNTLKPAQVKDGVNEAA